MQTIKKMIQQIQTITYDAYKASGQTATLLEEPSSPPEVMAKALEQTAANLEQGTVPLASLRALFPLKQLYRGLNCWSRWDC